jgi:hypothetical protein
MNLLSRKLTVPAIAAGLLLGGLSASQAQVPFTFTSSNDAAGLNGGTTVSSPGTGVITGTGAPASGASFVDTPGDQLVAITTPTNIRPFTITPTGVGGTATFDDPFSVTIDLTSNGDTVPFVFNGFRLAGTLDNTGLGSDTVYFTSLNLSTITHNVGGANFSINLSGFTPPGTTGSLTPDGTLSFFVQSSTVPEPGTVAMLIGMGVSGSAFVLRRRRK